MVHQMSFAEEKDCEWQWSKRVGEADWEVIQGATQKVYTPQQEDKGKSLRVSCTPIRCRWVVMGYYSLSMPFTPRLSITLGCPVQQKHNLAKYWLYCCVVKSHRNNLLSSLLHSSAARKVTLLKTCSTAFRLKHQCCAWPSTYDYISRNIKLCLRHGLQCYQLQETSCELRFRSTNQHHEAMESCTKGSHNSIVVKTRQKVDCPIAKAIQVRSMYSRGLLLMVSFQSTNLWGPAAL